MSSSLFIAIILFLALSNARNVNDFRPTRLLPIDGSIVHIAGQINQDFTELQSFNNYSNYLKDGTKPMGAMYYVALTLPPQNITMWFQQITQILNNNTMYKQDQWLSIQIGFWYYGLADEVAAGQYDEQLGLFVSGFEKLGRPVYLRIGYEFNGGWAKFTPSSYIASYKHITNALRANEFCNKYVATVWDYTADGGGEPDDIYKNWYPGDDYVDWWGVNVFGTAPQSNAGWNSPLVTNFALLAVEHNFPVMIGESTPRQVGDWPTAGCLENSSWAEWYQGYFSFINNASYGVQGFSYINWNWLEAASNNWGNSEINQCIPPQSDVGPLYQQTIQQYTSSGMYFSNMNETATKKRLGLL